MKKRIVCVLLTLIMLVSLVPATALTASAASLKTSEAAITIMKKLAIFRKNCYQVTGTNEFRIGYGTVCSEKHETKYEGGNVVIRTLFDKRKNTSFQQSGFHSISIH